MLSHHCHGMPGCRRLYFHITQLCFQFACKPYCLPCNDHGDCQHLISLHAAAVTHRIASFHKPGVTGDGMLADALAVLLTNQLLHVQVEMTGMEQHQHLGSSPLQVRQMSQARLLLQWLLHLPGSKPLVRKHSMFAPLACHLGQLT